MPRAGKSEKSRATKKAEKPQAERFKEAARQLGVDETGAEFERLFAKIVPPKPHGRESGG
jgi:hypothetical protein